ncbi:hypothetical protein B296_00039234 [Ensete ventricosum]|uniref:Uncharacterized protein n=1 Tax=Ensete ventricosum TaxID=4639 RepID=A0A426X445_ENSVE|nr:hypothetical protein B296_00039234 [Ensete ventricosum]
MTRPSVGLVGHNQAPCRGATASLPTRGRPAVAKFPCKGTTDYGQGPLQGGGWMLPGLAHKGSSRAGIATYSVVPARATNCRAPARSDH